MLSPRWLSLHFHGELYHRGRLRFQRGRIGSWTGGSIADAGLPLVPGDPALALHIPDFLGPLTPQAVDRSLSPARAFFARHYPEEPYQVAICDSWLLGAQPKDRLPADSDIVRFRQRFRLSHRLPDPEDTEPVRFVFGTEAAGALAVAATQVGHAVPAARGQWVTNEKRLLERAGLRAVDDLVARLGSGGPGTLETVLGQAETLFAHTVRAALA
ncbi:hypothetical protein [Streptomyces antibioticus]|uniref:hypothetical protein n=1 Tax=Streptomyces antibioticus TaxID=1890 RepID=UPI0033C6E94C